MGEESNNGRVSGGANNIGGLAGSVNTGKIQNCINYAEVSVIEAAYANNVAGVAGLIKNCSTVKNCLTTGNVSGKVNEAIKRGGISGIVGMIIDEPDYEYEEEPEEVCSTVSYCVALGQSLIKSGDWGSMGRIAIRDENEQQTSNNFAWAGMGVWIDEEQISNEDFYMYWDGIDADAGILYKLWSDTEPFTEPDPGAGWDLGMITRLWAKRIAENWRNAGVWTLADGELPILTDMPEGTVQFDEFPNYISGVAGVTVSPGSASVKKGSTQAFTATVTGINDFDDAVTWSVSGANHAGTTISDSGVLSVAEEETASSLTVTAVSESDSGKSGTATVTVTSDATPYNPPPSGGNASPSTGSSPATVSTGSGTTETISVTTSNGRSSAALTSGLSSQLANGNSVTISFPETDGVTDYSLSLPAAGLTAEGSSELTIVTSAGSVSLPSDMLTGIAASSGGNATFSIGKVDVSQLPEDAREAVGTRAVVSLSISIDGKPINWNNPSAPVTVSIPYTPSDGEDPNAIVIWYIDGEGKLNCITNGRYDAETGTVSFITTHFSYYAVGYNKVSFTDVPIGSWYYDAVTYLSAREVILNTSADTFGPGDYLTRGEFITLLLRAYGMEADDVSKDNFADAGNTYYTGYLAAAKRLGISSGIGNNKFGPEKYITRQEMFTFIYRTLVLIDKLPKASSGKSLENFSDSGDVAPYAREATAYLVKAGAISGSYGKLYPKDIATRAQVVQMIYNLLVKLG